MDRDIAQNERQAFDVPPANSDREPEPRQACRSGRQVPENPLPSREHALFRVRGSIYRLSPAELETMRDIGCFRTVAITDLARHRYQGQTRVMQQDLGALRAQGLVQTRALWTGPRSKSLKLVVLTQLGKETLERHGSSEAGQSGLPDRQALYAGFVKPNEVRHDAAIYRMFQAERQKIERAGGRIQRLVLDYELKRKVYAPMAKARALSPAEYARRQEEVARQHGLKVIAGKIPLPDLRIEYETASGEPTRVDLELATGHYHGPALQAKAQAGFKFYAADGSGARLSRVLEERDITVAILSL